MEPNFELRLIRVNWSQKSIESITEANEARNSTRLQAASRSGKSIESITEANEALPLELTDDGWSAESMLYPKVEGLNGQLAVRSDTQPTVRTAQGRQQDGSGQDVKLEQITNPLNDSDHWWIEMGEWKKTEKSDESGQQTTKGGYFDAPSCRTAGEMIITIGEQQCRVSLAPTSFTADEFNSLMEDFQDELFGLIVKKSYIITQGWLEIALISPEVRKVIGSFVGHVEKILQSPKLELREGQGIVPLARIRPVPRTFMEIAAKGYRDKVTGRLHYSSFNTEENMCILGFVERVWQIIKRYQRNLQKSKRSLEQRYDRACKKIEDIEQIENNGWRVIESKARLQNEIDAYSEELDEEERNWAREIEMKPEVVRRTSLPKKTIDVLVTSKWSNYENGLLYNVNIKQTTTSAYTEKKHRLYWHPDSTNPSNDWLKKHFEQNGQYRLRISFTLDDEADDYETTTVYHVHSIKIVNLPIDFRIKSIKDKVGEIKGENWLRKLERREIEELQRNKSAQEKLRDTAHIPQELIDAEMDCNNLEARLRSIRSVFKNLQVKVSYTFPHSITFVQNPHYAGALTTFRLTLQRVQTDEGQLEGIYALGEVGILDLATIYERWCLLKLILILTDDYGFSCEQGDWRQGLLTSILERKGKFKGEFVSDQLNVSVSVLYQEDLPIDPSKPDSKNLRPDFLLCFTDHMPEGEERKHTLVLDAKCKDYDNDNPTHSNLSGCGTLADDAIKIDAKYRRDAKDHIYVIHPSEGAVVKPRASSSQPWSNSSYYGGSWLSQWRRGIRLDGSKTYDLLQS